MVTSKKQEGATLFTGLMFLIMLSLMVASTSKTSVYEERMAGNSKNRSAAFQVAESTLTYVDGNFLSGENISNLFSGYVPVDTVTGGSVAGQSGLRKVNTCLPNSIDYWNGAGANDCNGDLVSFSWAGAGASRSPTISYAGVAAQPQYVVERYPDDGANEKYRVTVRAVGGTSDAVVVLQAMYLVHH